MSRPTKQLFQQATKGTFQDGQLVVLVNMSMISAPTLKSYLNHLVLLYLLHHPIEEQCKSTPDMWGLKLIDPAYFHIHLLVEHLLISLKENYGVSKVENSSMTLS